MDVELKYEPLQLSKFLTRSQACLLLENEYHILIENSFV